MKYTVSFIWLTDRCDPFDHVSDAALHRYQQLQRESLTTPGGVLPVPSPSDWNCSVKFEDTNEHVYHATFFSTLEQEEFRRLMESRLVPVFADRLEVCMAKASERSAVLSN